MFELYSEGICGSTDATASENQLSLGEPGKGSGPPPQNPYLTLSLREGEARDPMQV